MACGRARPGPVAGAGLGVVLDGHLVRRRMAVGFAVAGRVAAHAARLPVMSMDRYKDDPIGFVRDVLGKRHYGKVRAGQLATRAALDDGKTVLHCHTKCTTCGGAASLAIRLEKIAGMWRRTETTQCSSTLAAVIGAVERLNRPLCPIDRRVL